MMGFLHWGLLRLTDDWSLLTAVTAVCPWCVCGLWSVVCVPLDCVGTSKCYG